MGRKACPLIAEKIRLVEERVRNGERGVVKICRELGLRPETYRSYVAREKARQDEERSWTYVGVSK